MTSLTETAYYARRTINWIILGIIAYVILRLLWGLVTVVFLAVFPPKPPPPNHAFGKLPAVKFPAQQATPSGQLVFQLETIQGAVPAASESAAVYFMPKSPPNLLALTRTQDFAKRFLFDPAPIQESKNIYRFNDPEFPLRRLRYDIISSNFILRYFFEQDLSVFVEKNLPTPEMAKQETMNLLQSYSLYQDDLADGNPVVSYFKLNGNGLFLTTSLSQSDAVRIDVFRNPVKGIPVVTPNPDEANISVILSGSNNRKKRIIQLAYTYWPVDYLTNATYPLKTSQAAWDELQQGTGYIARYPKNTATAVVRNVYIGYFDAFEPQNYLQPVFVFEGDNGFLGYVPAISPAWSE
jgi:hypothetical protein